MSRALTLGRASNLFFAFLLSLLLAACGGDDDNDTASNNPPPPPPQEPSGILTRTAAKLDVTVTNVTVSGAPVVDFTVRNEFGDGFVGLPLTSLQFNIAKLIPAANGNPSRWQNYINRSVKPGAGALPGATAQIQATTERTGTLVDHGNGNYTYTFATDITSVTSPLAVSYEPNLTHRLAIQISGGTVPVTNVIHTWQPSSGATTGIFTRDIVKVESCNGCHDRLAFHGGGRVDTRYCVTCHNPGTTDPETGNTIDAKVLFHKLHRGAGLPSVMTGDTYSIVGFGGAVHDYSHLKFPQDIRNCTKCHDAADPATPDAGNWMTQINRTTCGSCHDDVDFATGTGHLGGPVTSDAECVFCHMEGGLAKTVAQAHVIPTKEPAAKFAYTIDNVAFNADRTVTVTFSVVDPTNNNSKYTLTEDAWTMGSSALNVNIAWNTADYTNTGSGSGLSKALQINVKTLVAGGSLTPNPDGSFTISTPAPLPVAATGSGSVAIEGRPVATGLPPNPTAWTNLAVKNAITYFAIDDPAAVARRQVVDIVKCQGCHETLALHGNNRVNEIGVCVTCHNPNNTDKGQRPADPLLALDGKAEESIDFKRMIHGIHSANATRSSTGTKLREDGLVVYGHGGKPFDFSNARFPGKAQNCETCHLPNTYTLPMKAGVLGSTVNSGTLLGDPSDDTKVSPAAAVCSSCHDSQLAQTHMTQNGADYVSGAADAETCAMCHGTGRVADVKVVHAKTTAAH